MEKLSKNQIKYLKSIAHISPSNKVCVRNSRFFSVIEETSQTGFNYKKRKNK